MQRKIIERKIESLAPLRKYQAPPSGWLKAIRGALGISTRQIAERIGIRHEAIVQFEQSEVKGGVSLATLQKVARAMNCKLVYAIVPAEPFSDLEGIIDDQALKTAASLVSRVDHTMRLEKQGTPEESSKKKVKEVAIELKSKMDSNFWSIPERSTRKKKSK